ncbi:hypothetical protein BDZ89DRAFT_1068805 [Hymenopellis radicata]|nr:hypothetical protein BDZ89DRAFT_1068805 [Hymenopellis radicata]
MELGSNFAAKLEPFLLMSKSAKGAAAAKLIQDATSAPGVFVFAELLELPNIQELGKHETHEKFLSLLQLFSYKTYQDYLKHKDVLPPLNNAQTIKLKHLSIVSMAAEKRVCRTTFPPRHATVRELEDLIIDAIYLDMLRGKLDQKEGQFEVEYTMGRDLEPGKIESVLAASKTGPQPPLPSSPPRQEDRGRVKVRRSNKKMAERHEQQVQAVLKEVKEKDSNSSAALERSDRMDVDYEPSEEREESKSPQENVKPQRKRNRF